MDDMTFDKKLNTLKKFLENDRQKRDKKNNEDLEKKELDKDKFRKETKKNIMQEQNKKVDVEDVIDIKKIIHNEKKTVSEINRLQDTEFNIIIQVDKKKLSYIKSIDKYEDLVEDSNLFVMKSKDNKYVFPNITISFLQREIEIIRDWKNDKTSITIINQGNPNYLLLKKEINKELQSVVEKFFKRGTYHVDNITIGKEYTRNKFMVYVQISNPVEKCKSVKLISSRSRFDNEKYNVYSLKIDDLINMAVKYSTDISNINKDYTNSPFSAVVMLYLAEVTLQEDISNM